MKDLRNRIPCSVSQELVDLVANRFPQIFMLDGEVLIHKLLFHIGFKLDHNMKTMGYYKNFDVLVRDNTCPSKIYKTRCVYNGEVRNLVLKTDPISGYITYSKSMRHPLAYLYESVEVLQPKNLVDIIPDEDFSDILDIGDPTVYDKAFLVKEKPSKQTTRNIVRSS